MATISDNKMQAVTNNVQTQPHAGFLSRSQTLVPHLVQLLTRLVAVHSIGFLRLSLAIVFVWFGLLKLVHPALEFGMVTGTTYWFPLSSQSIILTMGVAEILMGAAILFGVGVILRLGLLFVLLHMLATFTVLVLMPDLAFKNGNPLLLTSSGEYVIKNLVLIAAALVVLRSITDSEKKPIGQSLNGTSVNGHSKGPIHEIQRTLSPSTANRNGHGLLGTNVNSMSQRLDTLYDELEEATRQIAEEANRQIAVSEKLANIGQLSAGIADDLLNPSGVMRSQGTAIPPKTSKGSKKRDREASFEEDAAQWVN